MASDNAADRPIFTLTCKKAAKIMSENGISVTNCICLSAVLIVWFHRHAVKLTLSPSQVILVSDYISSKLLELLKECFSLFCSILAIAVSSFAKTVTFVGKGRNNTVVRQHM